MKPKNPILNFEALQVSRRELNDNNKEQEYLLNGHACLFIYYAIAINFPL